MRKAKESAGSVAAGSHWALGQGPALSASSPDTTPSAALKAVRTRQLPSLISGNLPFAFPSTIGHDHDCSAIPKAELRLLASQAGQSGCHG